MTLRERFIDIGTLSVSQDVVSLSEASLPGYASAWLLLEVTLAINGANTDELILFMNSFLLPYKFYLRFVVLSNIC